MTPLAFSTGLAVPVGLTAVGELGRQERAGRRREQRAARCAESDGALTTPFFSSLGVQRPNTLHEPGEDIVAQ